MFGAPMGPRRYGTGELFHRRWKVTIATLAFTGLDIAFRIEKSLKDEPNKCQLSVWNLNTEHRAAIEALNPETKIVSATTKAKAKVSARKMALKGIPVKIEAGLGEEGDLSLLWLGDLRSGHSVREGPDWVTKFESGDGEKAYQNARMNVSYGPKTPVATALRAMVRALGVGPGNVEAMVHKLEINGVGRIFPQGTVYSGPVVPHLNDFARSAGIEWSIQDGNMQILDRGKALEQRKAITVSAETGMLDSPTVDVDGILTVKMLLVPEIWPGRILVLEADRIKGNYRADAVTYVGDSAGDDWGVEIQASRLPASATY